MPGPRRIALAVPPIVLSLSLSPLTDLTSQLWLVGQMGALQSELGMAIGLYAAFQIVLFLAVLAIVHIPAVRRRLTPRALKAHRVAKAAHHQFVSISARASDSKTGVLIFVSLDDRQVQILADAGIHQKCGEAPWTAAADAITSAMRADQDPTSGIVGRWTFAAPRSPSTSPRPGRTTRRSRPGRWRSKSESFPC